MDKEEEVFKQYFGMKVWQLRHLQVSRFIDAHQIHSICDFGCSEGTLIQRLSRSPTLHHLIGVDIDPQALNQCKHNTYSQDIQRDLQYTRNQDQIIQIYQADITMKYKLFKKTHCQLLILIEVIEHVPQCRHDALLCNVFAYIRPNYVIVSTPNREFNSHFHLKEGQFRHWDHKFEWDRKQFFAFCSKIAESYRYSFIISGVGEHQNDQSKGCCTQFAFFTKNNQEYYSSQELNEKIEEAPKLYCITQNLCWYSNRWQLLRNVVYRELVQNSYHLCWQKGLQLLRSSLIGKKMLERGEQILARQEAVEWNASEYYLNETSEQSEMVQEQSRQSNECDIKEAIV